MSVHFGNRELAIRDLLRLGELAGPVRDQSPDTDGLAIAAMTLFASCERQQFTRAEVLELVQIIARMQPDECDMEGDELRLWWD